MLKKDLLQACPLEPSPHLFLQSPRSSIQNCQVLSPLYIHTFPFTEEEEEVPSPLYSVGSTEVNGPRHHQPPPKVKTTAHHPPTGIIRAPTTANNVSIHSPVSNPEPSKPRAMEAWTSTITTFIPSQAQPEAEKETNTTKKFTPNCIRCPPGRRSPPRGPTTPWCHHHLPAPLDPPPFNPQLFRKDQPVIAKVLRRYPFRCEHSRGDSLFLGKQAQPFGAPPSEPPPSPGPTHQRPRHYVKIGHQAASMGGK